MSVSGREAKAQYGSIVACLSTRNEADIIECSLRHMLAEDVDLILVADRSDPGEGTRETLMALAEETGKIEWFDEPDPNFRQSQVMRKLCHMAWEGGADWVIPFDADEFFYSPTGTIAQALTDCSYQKLCVENWFHKNWDYRYTQYNNAPKVAFRARPNPPVGMGQHYHTHGDGGLGAIGVLYCREFQFRSYEHYRAKIADRMVAFREEALARDREPEGTRVAEWLVETYGQHGKTEEEIRALWDSTADVWPCHNRPSVYDPIPSRTLVRPKPWVMA